MASRPPEESGRNPEEDLESLIDATEKLGEGSPDLKVMLILLHSRYADLFGKNEFEMTLAEAELRARLDKIHEPPREKWGDDDGSDPEAWRESLDPDADEKQRKLDENIRRSAGYYD